MRSPNLGYRAVVEIFALPFPFEEDERLVYRVPLANKSGVVFNLAAPITKGLKR
jgi:hypothetical protein